MCPARRFNFMHSSLRMPGSLTNPLNTTSTLTLQLYLYSYILHPSLYSEHCCSMTTSEVT